jgi:hypothetical protein
VPPNDVSPSAATGRTRRTGIDMSVRAAQSSPAMLSRSLRRPATRRRDVTFTFRVYKQSIRANAVQERMLALLSQDSLVDSRCFSQRSGLYGVMTYAVSRRRTEIGFRWRSRPRRPRRFDSFCSARRCSVALGGRSRCRAIAVGGAVRHPPLLFGLQPRDPATLAGAAVVLAAIGGLASWIRRGALHASTPARVLRKGKRGGENGIRLALDATPCRRRALSPAAPRSSAPSAHSPAGCPPDARPASNIPPACCGNRFCKVRQGLLGSTRSVLLGSTGFRSGSFKNLPAQTLRIRSNLNRAL